MKPRERVEYLGLTSGVRGLEEKNKFPKQKEGEKKKLSNNNTPILHLYCLCACFALRQSMTSTPKYKSFPASVWKLSIETGH